MKKGPIELDNAILRNLLMQSTGAYERQMAELFAEKEIAQVTLASIGDGVLATDDQGRVKYLNPVAEKLTGWERAEALGRPLPEIFRLTEPAGGDREIEIEELLRHCLEEGRSFRLAERITLERRDGRRYAIEKRDLAEAAEQDRAVRRGVHPALHDRRGRRERAGAPAERLAQRAADQPADAGALARASSPAARRGRRSPGAPSPPRSAARRVRDGGRARARRARPRRAARSRGTRRRACSVAATRSPAARCSRGAREGAHDGKREEREDGKAHHGQDPWPQTATPSWCLRG